MPRGSPAPGGIESIRRDVLGCTRCALCKTRTSAVPGAGDAGSRLMFVGEAPGRREDAAGEPFVGSAGRYLSDALEHAGIDRGSVYITNVVKCRPPDNRVPTDAEREQCAAHLRAEIRLVRPEIICVMGNTAFGSLLGGRNITRHRGRVFRRDGQDYFVTVHPAAAIYNRRLLGVLREDMRSLAGMIPR